MKRATIRTRRFGVLLALAILAARPVYEVRRLGPENPSNTERGSPDFDPGWMTKKK